MTKSSRTVATIKRGLHNLPAGAVEEPRAFPIFETIPPGCTAFRVEDSAMEPHIGRGECAVVDTNDREIILEEVFLVLQNGGPILWQVNKPSPSWIGENYAQRSTAMLSPLNKPKRLANGDQEWPKPLHLSDGPIYIDALVRMTDTDGLAGIRAFALRHGNCSTRTGSGGTAATTRNK